MPGDCTEKRRTIPFSLGLSINPIDAMGIHMYIYHISQRLSFTEDTQC